MVPALDLSHLAASGARFVTGWELLHDARTLTRLGPGRMDADLLRGGNSYAGRWIPPLVILQSLRLRLAGALAEGDIEWGVLRVARLAADVTLQEQPASHSIRSAWSLTDDIFICCTLQVELRLGTEEGSWTGRHTGSTAWPRSWGLGTAR